MSKLILILSLLSLGLSCGKKSSKKTSDNRPKPTDQNGNNQSNKNSNSGDENKEDGEEIWYGMASKCLVKASEAETDGTVYLKQELECSPIISHKDRDQLTKRLEKWVDSNCPGQITIQNGSDRNFKGCWIEPYGTQVTTSNQKSEVAKYQDDPEYCSGVKGRKYGVTKCNNRR